MDKFCQVHNNFETNHLPFSTQPPQPSFSAYPDLTPTNSYGISSIKKLNSKPFWVFQVLTL